MTNEHNENELGIEFVSFKMTSVKGITYAISMNYCNKKDLRFKKLKGISSTDTAQHEYELECAKETLENVEVN